jgi:hypothetical protein
VNRTKRRHQGIVGIEHGHAAGRQFFNQLSFGQRHRLNRFEGFYMRVTYVRDHADIRAGYPRQRAYFARVIHPHLEHRHTRFIGKPQNRKRHAHVVVQIPDGLPTAISAASSAIKSLSSSFRRARHAHNSAAPAATRPRGKFLQGRQRPRRQQLQLMPADRPRLRPGIDNRPGRGIYNRSSRTLGKRRRTYSRPSYAPAQRKKDRPPPASANRYSNP